MWSYLYMSSLGEFCKRGLDRPTHGDTHGEHEGAHARSKYPCDPCMPLVTISVSRWGREERGSRERGGHLGVQRWERWVSSVERGHNGSQIPEGCSLNHVPQEKAIVPFSFPLGLPRDLGFEIRSSSPT